MPEKVRCRAVLSKADPPRLVHLDSPLRQITLAIERSKEGPR